MKTKFGTALALAAVLLTGSAAAAINTQALNSPSGSTLGTASNILLPVNQAVVVTPIQTPTTTVDPTQTQGASPSAPSATSKPNQPVSPAATVATPATSQSATSMTSAPSNPSVVYGNPNPTNGDDGDDNDGDDD